MQQTILNPPDTRDRARKIGDTTRKMSPIRAKLDVKGLAMPDAENKAKPITANLRKKRDHVRDIALEAAPQMLLNLMDIAMTGINEGARVAASKIVIETGTGKPAIVHTNPDGDKTLPKLIIISGTGAPPVQMIAHEAEYEILDQDDANTD